MSQCRPWSASREGCVLPTYRPPGDIVSRAGTGLVVGAKGGRRAVERAPYRRKGTPAPPEAGLPQARHRVPPEAGERGARVTRGPSCGGPATGGQASGGPYIQRRENRAYAIRPYDPSPAATLRDTNVAPTGQRERPTPPRRGRGRSRVSAPTYRRPGRGAPDRARGEGGVTMEGCEGSIVGNGWRRAAY